MEFNNHKKKGFCEIRVKGRLEPHWMEWFDLMNVAFEADMTVISGFVVDQPALKGLIDKISMLGMRIVSIEFNGGQNGQD